MAFVNKQGGDEASEDRAAAGEPIDFDPTDESVVKVHYDLSGWTFDQRAELSEALAEAGLPHVWDDDELVLPEAVEEAADAMFDKLEAELGPFPVALDDDDEAVEYGLDEWERSDRTTLTEAIVEAEIPHRWDGATLMVAADAEEDVDALLDAIEAGELGDASGDGPEPPEGALSDIFLAAKKLAKNPIDAKARRTLIEMDEATDPAHPPYALPPRVWKQATAGVAGIVEVIRADADGDADDDNESSEVAELAKKLQQALREYV